VTNPKAEELGMVNRSDHPIDTIGASKARLLAAQISFGSALFIFFGTAIGECIYLWTAECLDWWRSIPVVTAAVFALALLRAAVVLSVPIDMKYRIDLEEAKGKSKQLTPEKAVELVSTLVKAANPKS
jgi:hypothetical protein